MKDIILNLKKLLDKEIVRYVIAGGMTTLVNLVSFMLLRVFTDFSRSAANVVAIMLAIIFAFFVNRFFVFVSDHRNIVVLIREFVSFVGMRLFAMLVEFVSKIIIQVIVLVINYIFSKCFVFKKNKKSVKQFFSENYIMVVTGLVLTVFMAVLWIVSEIGPFGGNSLTMVDSLHQYLPFFSDYHDKLVNEGMNVISEIVDVYQRDSARMIGYTLKDFNGDGVPELVLGRTPSPLKSFSV